MSDVQLPNNWELKSIGDIAETTGGYGFPKKFQGEKNLPFPFAKVSDMNLPENETYIVTAANTVDQKILDEIRGRTCPPGTIIFPKIGGAIATNKKRILGVEAIFDNNVMGIIPDKNKVMTKWCYYYLVSIDLMQMANIGPVPSIRQSTIQEFPIPIPYPDDPERSLDVQRRIVARIEALLIEVREMRKLHDEITADTTQFMNACIQEIFGQQNSHWKTENLSDVAFIQTGVAKGGRYGNSKLIEISYLRVANVQAGYLDLEEIKTIAIPEERLERYSLEIGDLLLTEGGDYDKLGRGAIWEGQIDPCIHQNHVFAVRFEQEKVLPKFAEYEMQSRYAKDYFLRVAKKTTNLASINKTQLSNFPIRYPTDLNEQEQIVRYLDTIQSEVVAMQETQNIDSELIDQMERSILAQAFRGEL